MSEPTKYKLIYETTSCCCVCPYSQELSVKHERKIYWCNNFHQRIPNDSWTTNLGLFPDFCKLETTTERINGPE